jgi:hypothetical protein
MDNKEESRLSKLSEEGLNDWEAIRSQLERHAMKKQKTQAFGREVDILQTRYPCVEDYPDEAELKMQKEYYMDRGIVSQSQFEVQNMILWATLADVVVDCIWATALCEQHRGHYVKAIVACDHHVVSRENDHRTMDKRELITDAFAKMHCSQDVVNNILVINQHNSYIKKMGISGVPYSDNELLIMLRQRMRAIGEELKAIEINSHLPPLQINTWESLSTFLGKAIQQRPTETSHALALQAKSTTQGNRKSTHQTSRDCYKCGSPDHIGRDCQLEVTCDLCPPRFNGSHSTKNHGRWQLSYDKWKQRTDTSNNGGNRRANAASRSTSDSSHFMAFTTMQKTKSTEIYSPTNLLKGKGFDCHLFYDSCSGNHGTGDKEVLHNLRRITNHDNMHTLAGVDGHPDKPDWEGDMKYYILDSEGKERVESHVASYYASWDKKTHLVSTHIQDANTATLASGLVMRTSQFDSINSRVNRQVPLEDGSVERFCIPIHTIGNTARMIVRLIHPGDKIEIQTHPVQQTAKALATLNLTETRLTAAQMYKRFAYPSQTSLEEIAKGAMPGHHIIDGMRDVRHLDLPEEKIVASATKAPMVKHNRDPQAYQDGNFYNLWSEMASMDIHGPYTQSVSGSKYFLLVRYDTGIMIVRAMKEMTTLLEILDDIFIQAGRPRHFLYDSGSQNLSSNPDMLSELQVYLAKKEIAVKVAAVEAQWENGHNEVAGRHIYEAAVAMCTGVGLPIKKFWSAAVTYKAQVENVLPRKGLHGKSFFEIHYGRKPYTLHFRRWGVPSYAAIDRGQRIAYERSVTGETISGAFCRRARRCVFLGLVTQSKPGTYWMYDMQTQRLIKSRNVTFDEDMKTVRKHNGLKWEYVLDSNTDESKMSTVQTKVHEDQFDQFKIRTSTSYSDDEDEIEITSSSENATTSSENSTSREEQGYNAENSYGNRNDEQNHHEDEKEKSEDEDHNVRSKRTPKKIHRFNPSGAASTWNEDNDAAEKSYLAERFMELETDLPRDEPRRALIATQEFQAESKINIDELPTSKVQPFSGSFVDILDESRLPPTYHKFKNDIELTNKLPPGKHASLCKSAVEDELFSFQQAGALSEPMELPINRVAHRMQLIMTNKAPTVLHPQGRVKARAVVCGSTFVPSYDFDPSTIYSAGADRTTVRTAFAFANEINAKIIVAADIKTAFLYAKLKDNEVIYIHPLPGMGIKLGQVFRVLVPIYGMPQSSARLTETFNEVAATVGCYPFKTDSAFYMMKIDDDILCFPRHVDDMSPLIATSPKILNTFMKGMGVQFEIIQLDFSKGDRCLGMEVDIDRDNGRITLTSKRQIEIMLNMCGFEDVKPSKYPVRPISLKKSSLQKVETDIDISKMSGHLIFIATTTRPDIAVAASTLSSARSAPTTDTLKTITSTMGYCKHTKDLGITYQRGTKNANQACWFVDADWGGSQSRRSRHGWVCILFGGVVAYRTSMQKLVALSSAWSETIALSEAMRFNKWFRAFLHELGVVQNSSDMLIRDPADPSAYTLTQQIDDGDEKKQRPIQYYEDNQAAIAIAEAPVTKLHEKTRSIGIRDYFCRDCVASGEACVIYVPSKFNIADIMTKPLNRDQFCCLRDQVLGSSPIKFLT